MITNSLLLTTIIIRSILYRLQRYIFLIKNGKLKMKNYFFAIHNFQFVVE